MVNLYDEAVSHNEIEPTNPQTTPVQQSKPEPVVEKAKVTKKPTKKIVKKSAKKASKKAVRKGTAQKLLDETTEVKKRKVNQNYSPVILRIFFGAIFFLHGAQKLFGAFGGGGIQGTTKFLESIPLFAWAAGLFAVILAIVEFFGGIALILGIFTRTSAVLLAIVSFLAIITVHLGNGFFMPSGIEYPLLLLVGSISLAISGPGSWAFWDKY